MFSNKCALMQSLKAPSGPCWVPLLSHQEFPWLRVQGHLQNLIYSHICTIQKCGKLMPAKPCTPGERRCRNTSPRRPESRQFWDMLPKATREVSVREHLISHRNGRHHNTFVLVFVSVLCQSPGPACTFPVCCSPKRQSPSKSLC